MGAALFMWLLRAWKIGQLEAAAWQKEDENQDISSSDTASPEARTDVTRAPFKKSSLIKRMFMWKKV